MCKMEDSITDGPKYDDNYFDDYTYEELAKMAGDDLVEELYNIVRRVVFDGKEWK